MCKSLTCFAHVLRAVRLVLCGTLVAKMPVRLTRWQAGAHHAWGSSRPKVSRFSRAGRCAGCFALRLASSAACGSGSGLDVQAARFVRRCFCSLAQGRMPVLADCCLRQDACRLALRDLRAAQRRVGCRGGQRSFVRAGRCRCVCKGRGRTGGANASQSSSDCRRKGRKSEDYIL